jgi:hypothetical protein
MQIIFLNCQFNDLGVNQILTFVELEKNAQLKNIKYLM